MNYSGTLSASLEDYLEAIFNIIDENRVARPKDIAEKIKVSPASVTGALHALSDKELINYAPYSYVTLTPEGRKTAEDIVRRHSVLKDFFVRVLAVNEAEADKAACQMEHSITRTIVERFVQFAEFVETCPRGGNKWISGFGYKCNFGKLQDDCEKCVEDCLSSIKTTKGRRKLNKVKLSDLKPGQRCKIIKIGGGQIARRALEMGVTPGTLVEIKRVAPLGDPVEVKIKGYHLSLRKDEISEIDVEMI